MNELNTTIEIANTAISWMDKVTIIFSFLTMLGVFWSLYRRKKDFEKISIFFILPNGDHKLVDKNLTRKDCQRSEIQGVLRTKLPKGVSFYKIDYIGTDEYFQNIYKIQTYQENILYIKLKSDELKQFGLD